MRNRPTSIGAYARSFAGLVTLRFDSPSADSGSFLVAVTERGMPATDVLALLKELRKDDLPTHGGTTTAYVFDSGVPGIDDLAAAAHAAVASVNGLDPMQFPSVARIQRDLLDAVIPKLGGSDTAVGTVTSGGTESIMLAVLGARERWRANGGLGTPQIVIPVSGHGAFHKAAHLFGLDVVTVGVDPETLRADADAVARAINDQTAIVAVSAPSYPHGVIDPITEIAAAAEAAGAACHVDACMGGWILPFLRERGVEGPDFDLSVPGVTSLSVDMHKYGYVPKGVSLLLQTSAELRQKHWFAHSDWPGYSLVTPTLASSRPAGPMAAAWAVMHSLGFDTIGELAMRAHGAARSLAEGVATIDGLRTIGSVDSTLVAIADDGALDDPDIRVVIDEVSTRGWFIQAQPGYGSMPPTAHATLTPAAADRIPAFVEVLRESAAAARSVGRVKADPALVAEASSWDVASVDATEVSNLVDKAGVVGDQLPARKAAFYALIDEVPPPVANRIMMEVFNRALAREPR